MSQQENIYELPLFKAHVLLLADIVADFSGFHRCGFRACIEAQGRAGI